MIYLVIDDVIFVKKFKIIRFRELTNEIWTDTNRVTDTSSSTLRCDQSKTRHFVQEDNACY